MGKWNKTTVSWERRKLFLNITANVKLKKIYSPNGQIVALRAIIKFKSDGWIFRRKIKRTLAHYCWKMFDDYDYFDFVKLCHAWYNDKETLEKMVIDTIKKYFKDKKTDVRIVELEKEMKSNKFTFKFTIKP